MKKDACNFCNMLYDRRQHIILNLSKKKLLLLISNGTSMHILESLKNRVSTRLVFKNCNF